METNLRVIPFDIEKAKLIQNGLNAGRIITRAGRSVRGVVFDVKNVKAPVAAIVTIDDAGKECVCQYRESGCIGENLEDKDDLILEVPDYLTFKHGDIIACERMDSDFIDVLAFNRINSDMKIEYLYAVTNEPGCFISYNSSYPLDRCRKIRYATREERVMASEKLMQIKRPVTADGKASKHPDEFKPFQGILGRNLISGIWSCDFYSHMVYNKESDGDVYAGTSGNFYKECVPYDERTKHLRGTILNYE